MLAEVVGEATPIDGGVGDKVCVHVAGGTSTSATQADANSPTPTPQDSSVLWRIWRGSLLGTEKQPYYFKDVSKLFDAAPSLAKDNCGEHRR